MSESNGKEKVTLFTSRRECLIAAIQDTRKVFTASGTPAPVWGLASTEHQFMVEVARRLLSVKRLSATDLKEAMADELAATKGDS